jgi:hypothetical protein
LRSRAGRLARSLSVRGFGRYLEQRFRVDWTFSERLAHLHQRFSQGYCHLVRTLMCKFENASRLAQRESLCNCPNSVMMLPKQRDMDKWSLAEFSEVKAMWHLGGTVWTCRRRGRERVFKDGRGPDYLGDDIRRKEQNRQFSVAKIKRTAR